MVGNIIVVPARAGMSPAAAAATAAKWCGPRASGDEPSGVVAVFLGGLWSPRERG